MIAIAGLGIGASTTVFGLCQALLLRPFPFREPERLVWIANGTSENTLPTGLEPLVRIPFLRRSSVLLLVAPLSLAAQGIPRGEYADRRWALMERLPDGITLLHATPREKPESEPGFIQSASFFYFTGLG